MLFLNSRSRENTHTKKKKKKSTPSPPPQKKGYPVTHNLGVNAPSLLSSGDRIFLQLELCPIHRPSQMRCTFKILVQCMWFVMQTCTWLNSSTKRYDYWSAVHSRIVSRTNANKISARGKSERFRIPWGTPIFFSFPLTLTVPMSQYCAHQSPCQRDIYVPELGLFCKNW